MIHVRGLDSNLSWVVGDRPLLSGTFYINNTLAALLAATIRLDDNVNPSTEKIVEVISQNEFAHYMDKFIQIARGQIYFSGLIDSAGRAELDGSINDAVVAATVKTETGDIDNSGWCRIDTEWMTYTKSGTALTIVRGVFDTTAATHSTDVIVYFATGKESVIPIDYQVSDLAV